MNQTHPGSETDLCFISKDNLRQLWKIHINFLRTEIVNTSHVMKEQMCLTACSVFVLCTTLRIVPGIHDIKSGMDRRSRYARTAHFLTDLRIMKKLLLY